MLRHLRGIALPLLIIILYSINVCAQSGDPTAVVRAVEGDVTTLVGVDQEPTVLNVGTNVKAWEVVRTNQYSKALLELDSGVQVSMGEYGSVFLSGQTDDSAPVTEIQTTEGIIRVTGAAGPRRYAVITPVCSVEPNPDGSFDFIVESPTPTTSIVTVITGSVIIENLTVNGKPQTVSHCNTAYIEQAKDKLDVVATSGEDIQRLLAMSTIGGSPTADALACAPAPTASRQSTIYSQPLPDYYYADWDQIDPFEFDRITILPPRVANAPYYVILPGVGRWIVPAGVFGSWNVDPAIVEVYVRRIILDRFISYDRYYRNDFRVKKHQLEKLIYLSQIAGNRSALINAQKELDFLRVRQRWADQRLAHLDRRMRDLDLKRNEFASRLPRGLDLAQGLNNAFHSPKNVNVFNTFKTKVRDDFQLQNQVAGFAGKELYGLRAALAKERNPGERIRLHNQLSKIRRDVAQGKLPINPRQTQVKRIVQQISQERNTQNADRLRRELQRVVKTEIPQNTVISGSKELRNLEKNGRAFKNPEKRREFEQRVSELQKSVEHVQEAQTNFQKIDKLTDEAAKTRDNGKRQRLVEQISKLTAEVPSGTPGSLQMINKIHGLEAQLALENDKKKREQLQSVLEAQQRERAEALKKQEQEQKLRVEKLKQAEDQRGGLTERRKGPQDQKELSDKAEQIRKDAESGRMGERRPQLDNRKQAEELKRLQDQQADKLRHDQEEQKKRADELRKTQDLQQQQSEKGKHDQLEQQKKSEELKRLQDQQAGKVRPDQEEQKRRADELRKTQEIQQQQADKIKHDQENRQQRSGELNKASEQRQQVDKLKQQADEKKRADDARRALEKQKQADQIKRDAAANQEQLKQRELQKQRHSEELRRQGEARHKAEQIKAHEEQQRNAEQQRSRQQEQQRQEQLRNQQQDQIRKQQETMKRQQEHAQQEQLRKQQENQARQQQEMMRRQQEQQQKQQLHRQEEQSRGQQDMMRRQQEQTHRPQEMLQQQELQRRQQEEQQRRR